METPKNISYYINKIVNLQHKNEDKIEGVKRYALFPILDDKGYEFYQRQENSHWSEAEMDFTADVKFYNEATPQVKKVMDTILAFFLAGDGVISDNIIYRFLLECDTYEQKAMFISQLHIELVHAATYGLAAFTFKKDAKAMGELIESVQDTPCVIRKIQFMEKWMLADRPRYHRLVAFAVAEGIFFCDLFAVIFWFRSKGWFPNFILANELIAKDESLHRDYAIYLAHQEISKLLAQHSKGSDEHNKLTEEIKSIIYDIIEEGVSIEDDFSKYILAENLEDLNAKDLSTYTRLITDNLLVQLGYSVKYGVSNPFTWLDDISMEQKGNFYEVTVGAYSKKSLAELLNWRKRCGISDDQPKVDAYDNPEDINF